MLPGSFNTAKYKMGRLYTFSRGPGAGGRGQTPLFSQRVPASSSFPDIRAHTCMLGRSVLRNHEKGKF